MPHHLGDGSPWQPLGIWTATDDDLPLDLERSSGATRGGSVTAPMILRLTDDGGKVDADTRAVLESTSFDVNAISTDAVDDENTITLSNEVLGMTLTDADVTVLIDWYDDNPNGWTDDLEDLHPRRNVTILRDVLTTTAQNEINRLRRLVDSTTERNKYDDPGTHGQLTTASGDDLDSGYLTSHASAALELVFGSGPPFLAGSTAKGLYDNL